MFKRLIALCLSSVLFVATAAHADESEVRKAVESIVGKNAKVDSVRKAGVLGLYEVIVGGEIAYVDDKASYIIFGNIVDVKGRRDITEERKLKLSQIKFSDLPLDLAIKQVKGAGKRVIATFEDPNCGYCKRLAKELAKMDDVTVYTFLMPILSPDSLEKSQNIWCAADRVKAWNDWMVNGTAPAAAKCDTGPVQKSLAFGQKLNIRGTPTIFFADGSRVPGFMPQAQLEQALAKASK
jgi:thiol:disulfide interchange protein DsbC